MAATTRDGRLAEANGKFKFDKLPPLPFTVAVTEHSNNVIYNYFQLQGGKEVDLTDVSDTTDFIYYSPPQIELTVLDTNACGQQMLQQGGVLLHRNQSVSGVRRGALLSGYGLADN
jgi:hypothetical protein